MSEITFERCPHDRQNPYVMISREMIQDPSISPKAKGVLAYLLSLPSNWKIYHSQLQKGLNVGEDYINSAMDELIKEGYAERSRERVNGMYQPYRYVIREFKKCLPNGENQAGSSGPGNPGLQKKHSPTDTKETTTKEKPAAAAFFSAAPEESAPTQSSGNSGQLPIPVCLDKIDIPYADKTEISKRYAPEVITNAIGWATHSQNPPSKCLAASIKYACTRGLCDAEFRVSKTTPQEKVQTYFKNGEIYNGAECFIDNMAIAFQRGMKLEQVNWNVFSWDKLDSMCQSFGIPFNRNSK